MIEFLQEFDLVLQESQSIELVFLADGLGDALDPLVALQLIVPGRVGEADFLGGLGHGLLQFDIEGNCHRDRDRQDRCLLVTLSCWADVHPSLVTLPVEWEFSTPFGILYQKDPPSDVARFIETVRCKLAAG